MARYQVPSRIETERLVLRRYVPSDAEELTDLLTRNVNHLRRYMEWIKFEPMTLDQRRELIDGFRQRFNAGQEFTFGVFERGGGLVGGAGYHVRADAGRLGIGYWISADREGEGLVTEAAAALTIVALEDAGAELVDICHVPSNVRSASVPARLGYELQDEPGYAAYDDGERVPVVEWWATAAALAREPLASWPKPTLAG